MTKQEFIEVCNENLIDINIALDNDNIRDALAKRDDERVKEILLNEF